MSLCFPVFFFPDRYDYCVRLASMATARSLFFLPSFTRRAMCSRPITHKRDRKKTKNILWMGRKRPSGAVTQRRQTHRQGPMPAPMKKKRGERSCLSFFCKSPMRARSRTNPQRPQQEKKRNSLTKKKRILESRGRGTGWAVLFEREKKPMGESTRAHKKKACER